MGILDQQQGPGTQGIYNQKQNFPSGLATATKQQTQSDAILQGFNGAVNLQNELIGQIEIRLRNIGNPPERFPNKEESCIKEHEPETVMEKLSANLSQIHGFNDRLKFILTHLEVIV